MTTYVTSTLGGQWNDSNTWTPKGVPGAADRAEIYGPVYITDEQSADSTTLFGGDAYNGYLRFNGGILHSAVYGREPNTTVSVTEGGGYAFSVQVGKGWILDATFAVGRHFITQQGLDITRSVLKLNGETNDGLVAGNVSFNSSTLLLATTTTYGGGSYGPATFAMSDSASNVIKASNAGVIFKNSADIIGAGSIGAGTMSVHNGSNRDKAIIRATGNANALLIDTGPNGVLKNFAGSLIEASGDAGLIIDVADHSTGEGVIENDGIIQAVNRSKLTMSHVEVINTGSSPDKRAVIEAKDFGTVVLSNLDSVKNTNGDIRATGAGTIIMQNTQVNGGVLKLDGALTALFVKGQSVLRNVAFSSSGLVSVEAGAVLNVGGPGSYTLAATTVAGRLSFGQDLTFKGGKTVSITGELSVSYPTLTNVDEKIEGSGVIKTSTLVNQVGGTIRGSLTLDLVPYFDNAGLLTNAGTISGANVKAKLVDNAGTMSNVTFDVPYGVPGRVINNMGTGVINGSTFGRTEIVNAGVVGAGAGQTTSFTGTILHGGTLSSSDGGKIDVKASTDVTLLDPAKIAAGTTMVINNGATVELDGPPVLDDVSITIAGSTARTTLNLLSPSVTLKGGSIALSNSGNNRLLFTKLTNAAGQIVGAGEIAEVSPDVDSALINQAGGLIEAKGSADLTIRIDRLVNDGVLEADDSTLTIHTTETIRGGGEAFVTNGGKIDMSDARQFLGTLRYAGRGTILGPDQVPAGTMFGFATGASYVFGKTNGLSDQFTTKWTENAAGTGGTLTILAGAGQTYANLVLSGSYSSDDFAATQYALQDGNHVAVSFVGALKWAAAVDGNWQDVAKWAPTGLYAPGAFDNALIAAVDKDDPGKTYTVSVTQDTIVRSVATGGTATLKIEDARFTALEGTLRATNAGLVKAIAGASLTTGGTFTQAASGEIVAKGTGTTLNIAKDGGISGGRITNREGAALNAAGGTAWLTGVTIANSSAINVVETTLELIETVINGDGSVNVSQGSTLALSNSKISNNTIQLHGTLEIDTDTTLKSTVMMDDPGKIVSGGSAVTLTNDGTIGGAGRIGDATLTLVNKNAIVVDAGKQLDIATGGNTVVNRGNIFASVGAKLTFRSALLNTIGLNASGGTAEFNGSVDNSGLMRAGGSGSLLDFKDTLSNSGVVAAAGGGTVRFAEAVVQTADAELVADATNSKLLFGDGASVTGGEITLGYLALLETATGGEVALSNTKVTLHDNADIKIVDATLTIADSVVNANKMAEISASGVGSILVLANSTINGGTLDIDHAQMQVGGVTSLKDTGTVLSAARIVSDGAAATLTNTGLITADGMSRIDDDLLSLVNKGTITTGPTSGAALFIDTGGFNIENDGTIAASVAGTTVKIASQVLNGFAGHLLSGAGKLQAESVYNRGELKATGVGVIEVTGSVTNEYDSALIQASSGGTLKLGGSVNNSSGVIQAIDRGTIDVTGKLFNDGTVQATAAGTVKANVEVNLRRMEATGTGSVLDIAFTRPDGGNRGQIIADDGGLVTVETSVTNAAGARLLAKDGGEIEVLGAVTGGIARITGDGSVMDLDGSTTENTTAQVSFADNGIGQLMLGHSSRFTGTVAGYDTGDTIDVTDIAFVNGASFYDASAAQLRISDGIHNATIQLLGNYSASQFAFSSDGHGGTLVTGVAAIAPSTDLIPSLAAHT